MKRLLLLLVTMVALCTTSANAQRLLPAQKGLEVWGGIPLQKHGMFKNSAFSVGLNCIIYRKDSHYWLLGAGYVQQYYRYEYMDIPVRDYLAEGGVMLHLLSSPGKEFLVYTGMYATLGYEEVNDGKHLLEDGAYLNAGDRFIYGGGVQFSLEGFLTDGLLLYAKIKGHFLGGTDLDLFRPALNFGIRIIM